MSYDDSYNSSRRRDDDYRGDDYRDDNDRRRRDDYDSNPRNNNYERSESSYVPPSERAEYGGGGGRGSDNYYDNYNNPNSYTDDDRTAALSHAQQHGSSADDDETSIFSHALDFLGGNKASITSQNDIDEQAAIGAHHAVYGGGEGEQRHSNETLGAGAALQALKMFTGGGGSGLGGGSHGAGGGGNSQAKLIGMAMGQASKLWEEQNGKGNVVSTSSPLFMSSASFPTLFHFILHVALVFSLRFFQKLFISFPIPFFLFVLTLSFPSPFSHPPFHPLPTIYHPPPSSQLTSFISSPSHPTHNPTTLHI